MLITAGTADSAKSEKKLRLGGTGLSGGASVIFVVCASVIGTNGGEGIAVDAVRDGSADDKTGTPARVARERVLNTIASFVFMYPKIGDRA